MKRQAIRTLILWLAAPVCFGRAEPPPSQRLTTIPPYRKQIKYFEQQQSMTKVVLKSNDLTILVNEFHAAPLVHILAYVKGGLAGEPADFPGISDVLARVVYGGTGTRTPQTMREDLQSLGASVASRAGYAASFFEMTAPAAQWKRALEVDADALLDPRMDDEQLGRAVAESIRASESRLDEPAEAARRKLLELAIPDSGLTRLGSTHRDALKKITLEDLRGYCRSTFVPSRMILVVSGDVITSDILNESARLFGKASGQSTAPAGPAPEPAAAAFHYRQEKGAAGVAHVLLGFPAASAESEDYPALEMLRAILGLGEESILTGRLRNRKKAILDGNVDLAANRDSGYLTVAMTVGPEDIDRCEIAAFTEFEILKRRPPEANEIERARAQLELDYWRSFETLAGRAEAIARAEARGNWKDTGDALARLRKVDAADVTRVAKKYLNLDRCSILEYLPEDAAPRNLDAEKVREILTDLLEPSTREELAKREKETVRDFDIPEARPEFTPSEVRHDYQKASILRGPEIIIRENHTLPIVSLGFYFPGGKLFESSENAGVTELMLRSILHDSKDVDAQRVYRQLEIYGSRIVPVVEDDYFGVTLLSLSANVEKSLDLLIRLLKSPKFDEEEIQNQRRIQLGAVLDREKSLSCYPGRLLDRALFGGHSYAMEAGGGKASMTGLSPAAVAAWYKLHVENRKPVVVVLGDTQGTSLASFFVRNFSGSRFEDVEIPKDFVKPPEKRKTAEEEWNGSESRILLGFPAPPSGDADEFTMTVLKNYLSGRLNEAIEGGGSHWALSLRYRSMARGGSLTISAAGDPAGEENVAKLLEQEIGLLETKPISYRDYRSARHMSTGEFLKEQQRSSAEMALIVANVLAGKEVDDIRSYAGRLDEVRQEDLQGVAKRFLNLEKSVMIRLHGGTEK